MKYQQPKVEVNNYSIGFLGLLTILFITLKLIGIINWNWMWVLAPLWVGPGILLSIIAIVFIIAIIFHKK